MIAVQNQDTTQHTGVPAISPLPAQRQDLQAAFQRYIEYLDATPRTAQAYICNVRQFVKWLNLHGIEQPERRDIIAYRDDLKARCKPSTVQAYIIALRLFFKWTATEGIYPNIADGIKGAKVDTIHKRDYLTAAAIKEILSAIDTRTAKGKRDYSLLMIMATGGLRDIEVSRANIEDIQTSGGNLVMYLQGKGRDEKAEFVKIRPEAARAIKAYLATRWDGSEPAAPLFVSMSNHNKGQRMTTRSISAAVKARLRAAGYDNPRLTAHSLRHSAVTLALASGIPLDEVQQFARHRNISTTQIYQHNLDRISNRCEEAIAAAIFGA